MKKINLLILLLSFFLINTTLNAIDKNLKVSFVISRTVNDMFYGPVVNFMQEAANDLNVELLVIEADDNHITINKKVEESFLTGNKTSAVIAVSVKESGKRILEVCEKAKIPMMIENAAILDKAVGKPREHFKYYIGEILPDDEKAGYLLAKYLIRRAPIFNDGKIYLAAISGPYGTSASFEREKGLYRALSEHPNVVLKQMVRADWIKELAKEKFLGLKSRYDNISAVWTASDGMAIGVSEAIKELNLDSGIDIIVGGVDWSKEGLDAVKSGAIQATAGGHFLEGAWSLISVFDYLKGKDFYARDGINMKTDMKLITEENINKYEILFEKNSWPKINFKTFSKFYNDDLIQYDFDIDKVINQMKNN